MASIACVDVAALGEAFWPKPKGVSRGASLITSGALAPGSKLPTVRDFAADLGIAVGTVTRAYLVFETIGLVISRRRTGTVVTDGIRTVPSSVQSVIDALVRESHDHPVPDDTVIALVRGALITTTSPLTCSRPKCG